MHQKRLGPGAGPAGKPHPPPLGIPGFLSPAGPESQAPSRTYGSSRTRLATSVTPRVPRTSRSVKTIPRPTNKASRSRGRAVVTEGGGISFYAGRYCLCCDTGVWKKEDRLIRAGVGYFGENWCRGMKKDLVSPVVKLMSTKLMYPLFAQAFGLVFAFSFLGKSSARTQHHTYTTKFIPSCRGQIRTCLWLPIGCRLRMLTDV